MPKYLVWTGTREVREWGSIRSGNIVESKSRGDCTDGKILVAFYQSCEIVVGGLDIGHRSHPSFRGLWWRCDDPDPKPNGDLTANSDLAAHGDCHSKQK